MQSLVRETSQKRLGKRIIATEEVYKQILKSCDKVCEIALSTLPVSGFDSKLFLQ